MLLSSARCSEHASQSCFIDCAAAAAMADWVRPWLTWLE